MNAITFPDTDRIIRDLRKDLRVPTHEHNDDFIGETEIDLDRAANETRTMIVSLHRTVEAVKTRANGLDLDKASAAALEAIRSTEDALTGLLYLLNSLEYPLDIDDANNEILHQRTEIDMREI